MKGNAIRPFRVDPAGGTGCADGSDLSEPSTRSGPVGAHGVSKGWTPVPKLKSYDECFPLSDQGPYRDLIDFAPNVAPHEYGTGQGVTLPKSNPDLGRD